MRSACDRVAPLLLASALTGCASAKPATAPAAIPPPAADTTAFDPEDLAAATAGPVATPDPTSPRLCPDAPWTRPADLDFEPLAVVARQVLDETGTPSLAIGVAVDGKEVWARGFGYADLRGRRRATATTPYSLASVSKPITATALMVLAQNGDIDIEKPINDYLPAPGVRAGAGDPAGATVARVASHTSGLGLHYQFFWSDEGQRPPDPATTRQRHAVLVTPPGTVYQYSNLGYGLLEQVIANVSGRSYAEFVRAAVFGPLGMTHAYVGHPPAPAKPARRHGGDRRPLPDYGFDHDGASAIWASAEDMLRFGSLFAGTPMEGSIEILPEPARNRMFRVEPPSNDYGLGFGVRRVDGRPILSHSGGMPGVRTILHVYPIEHVVVTVLANSDAIGGGHRQLGTAVLDVLRMPARSDAICSLPASHPLIGRWTGTIDTDDGTEPIALSISHDGDVILTIGEDPPRIVRAARFADDLLQGEASQLEVPAGLGFSLHLDHGTLSGPVSTVRPSRSAITRFARLTREA